MNPADITVVIPALNEEHAISRSVHSAVSAGATEVIVSDGGSRDHTAERAVEAGASSVVRSLPGRGLQMNSAAHLATGKFLLFLHADNELSKQTLKQICVHEDSAWGAFQQQIDSRRKVYRLIEWGNDLRVRWRRVPFGDQGMFVRRSLFEELGGFAEIALMGGRRAFSSLAEDRSTHVIAGAATSQRPQMGEKRRGTANADQLDDSAFLFSRRIC